MKVEWPDGKNFAFTVFDDTDLATLHNVRPIYDLLAKLGLRTTKSIWPLKGNEVTVNDGDTCEDPAYLAWLQELKQVGFEIGYHMAASSTSDRQRTLLGLDTFEELFGENPTTMANHASCHENIYWGESRLTGWRRLVYNAVTRFHYKGRFRGHIEGDPLFWGDLCRERIKYVRGFVFPEINTLKVCPYMPYHDPLRPYVNYWFASSEGPDVVSFNKLLSESSLDRLEEEGGACIMYTHFGAGFYRDGQIDSRFAELMTNIASRNGWFVTVATLLDFLHAKHGHRVISPRERSTLERKWLGNKLFTGTS
jgi:hypothetical protein